MEDVKNVLQDVAEKINYLSKRLLLLGFPL
jgi:hypothetical protein